LIVFKEIQEVKILFASWVRLIVGCVSELHAGGNWTNASNASSQARNANNYRWNVNTNIGAQFATRIQGCKECEPNSLAGLLALFLRFKLRSKIHDGVLDWLVINMNVSPVTQN